MHADEVGREIASVSPANSAIALGEPAPGLPGWRQTHQQARAALPIARHNTRRVTRYSEVALLASMLQDDLLASSLDQLYLRPLEQERDGGRVLRETLRAYFEADRNVSSAAAALGVKRHTVTNRLRTVEERVACSLSSCAVELEAAMRFEELRATLLPQGTLCTH